MPRNQPTASVRRIVVVGAGDGGARAALALRQLGFDGHLSLIGEEATTPYERPALSKGILAADGATPASIASAAHLSELDIDFRPGTRAARIDVEHRTVSMFDGSAVPFDRLLLATGARACRLPMPGGEIVQSLRSFSDAEMLRGQLRKQPRVLVIGGGFVGLEVAATALGRGCSVMVVEFAHRLMSRVVPASVAEVIRDRHLAAGCDLRLGMHVNRLEQINDETVAHFSDGTNGVFDLVIGGVGAIPNTELAASAGLSIANGVAVDENLCSSDPAIFALGDCCSVPHPLYGGSRVRIEAWRTALIHAEVAGENMLGGRRAYDSVPWFWSDQYDLGLQIAGLHAFATHEVARPRSDGSELLFGLDSAGRIVSASGVAVGTAIARDIRLAEELIAQRVIARPAELSDSSTDLRSLLRDRQLSTTVSSIV